jgi:nucleotide-binding universal stress UspA family protein
MFKKILVPVDFSERAKAAFGHGALFATTFGAELELLHVVEDAPYNRPPFWVGEVPLIADLHKQAIENAKTSLAALLPQLQIAEGAPVKTSVESGAVAATIAAHAKESGTDLIVTATHGRTGLSHLLMGSVCERVLRRAPCPVLVARGAEPDKLPNLRKILVAVDLSDHSKRALELAAAIGLRLGASVEVLHSWAAPYFTADVQLDADLFRKIREGAEKELEEFLGKCQLPEGLELKKTVVSGVATATISERIAAEEPDLVVLGTHGHSGFKHMVLGSVAETVVRYAPCPTLVVP